MRRKKLLFLDIDGVLNNHAHSKDRHSFVPRICRGPAHILQELIVRSGMAEIVIISSWRSYIHDGHMTLRGFELMLKSHGIQQARVADVLPQYNRSLSHLDDRVVHLNNYIKGTGLKDGDYVVLDDLKLNVKNHVQPHPHYGLTRVELDKALEILKQ